MLWWNVGKIFFSFRHDLHPEASNGNKWSPIVLPRLSSISQPANNPIILLLLDFFKL